MSTVIFILILMTGSVSAQQPDWFKKIRAIKLLEASRADVIKLFGESKDDINDYNPQYQLIEGEMNIEYSRGLCGPDNKIGWNVPEYTVTRIFFFPSIRIKPNSLRLKLTEFRKYEVSDSPGFFVYESDKLGLYFNVKKDGSISSFEFRPSDKYNNLFCS